MSRLKSIGGKGLPAILIKEDDQMFYVVRWSDLAPEPKSVFVTIDIEMAQDFILKEIDRLITLKSDYDDVVYFGITKIIGGITKCAEIDMHA